MIFICIATAACTGSSLSNLGWRAGRPTTALSRGVLQRSRLAFILYHRLNLAQTVHDHFYRKHILQGQTTVRAGLTLLSDLQQRHGFAALVVILPAFLHPFTTYQHTHMHERVFQAAEGLPGMTVLDLLPSFAGS